MNLSDYKLWTKVVEHIDDETRHRIATAETYDSEETWNNNRRILSDIVSTGRLPVPLEFSVAEAASFFNLGSNAIANERDPNGFLFCSLLLLEIQATQEYDAGSVDGDLITALDCAQHLGAPWQALFFEYLEDRLKELPARIADVDLIYFETAKLISQILFNAKHVSIESTKTKIAALYSQHRDHYRCIGNDLLGIFLIGRSGTIWNTYFEKTKLLGWISEDH